MSARSAPAGIAGLCFLACGLIVGLAFVSNLLRVYGPALREWIHWMLTPQLVLGMLLGFILVAFAALLISLGEPL